jgi:TatD DNase family protein
MKLIDTHCHLNHEDLYSSLEQIVEGALNASVVQMFVVGWDKDSSLKAISIVKRYPFIKAIIGLHPVDSQPSSDLSWITELVNENRAYVVAIGECGLDYHWKKDPKEHNLQKTHLIEQIHISNQLELPIVIHCRDAYEEILPILKENPLKRGGVMHCYGGPSSLVKSFVELGFYISFGGPVTFKNAHEARISLRATPLEKLLIETDAPYLSPHPYRGKRNEPSLLPITFNEIKNLLMIDEEMLSNKLIANVSNLFHVKIL